MYRYFIWTHHFYTPEQLFINQPKYLRWKVSVFYAFLVKYFRHFYKICIKILYHLSPENCKNKPYFTPVEGRFLVLFIKFCNCNSYTNKFSWLKAAYVRQDIILSCLWLWISISFSLRFLQEPTPNEKVVRNFTVTNRSQTGQQQSYLRHLLWILIYFLSMVKI